MFWLWWCFSGLVWHSRFVPVSHWYWHKWYTFQMQTIKQLIQMVNLFAQLNMNTHHRMKQQPFRFVRNLLLLDKNWLNYFLKFISTKVGDNSNRFQWSQQLQGIILSSFFWGYILFEIPGGILVQKYGGRLILLISTFLSAIVVALTPFAVAYGEHYPHILQFSYIYVHDLL